MNVEQLNRMHTANGFIAALDQSGGSTPKALMQYGMDDTNYSNEEEMFDRVHEMRTRIITSPSFTSQHIIGAILFEGTMDRKIEGDYTADYLWNKKGILPFLKVDKGLADLKDGVQLMKAMPDLDDLLQRALKRNVFGTKMRSVIKEANPSGIEQIVKQQFEVAKQIINAGLVPIIEPEVDINSTDKKESEVILKNELLKQMALLSETDKVIFKLSIPDVDGFYSDLMKDKHVVRVVALSGGYSQKDANEKLARNPQLIASFSRALLGGLTFQQTEDAFDQTLMDSIQSIYDASVA